MLNSKSSICYLLSFEDLHIYYVNIANIPFKYFFLCAGRYPLKFIHTEMTHTSQFKGGLISVD